MYICEEFDARSAALIQLKMTSYQCRKSHCGDKTIWWTSHLHSGISYTVKMTSLYWDGALASVAWKSNHISTVSHYNDIMGAIASQITSLTIVYSTVYSDTDQRKHQSSESLAFVRGIHRGPVNSPHKWPVTRKMFPFDDVIMLWDVIIIHPLDIPFWLQSTQIWYPWLNARLL